MADNLGEAIVEIRADLSELRQGLQQARTDTNQATDQMTADARRAGDEMGRMGGRLSVIGEAAGGITAGFAAIGAAFAAAGTAAVISAAKYEQTEMAFTTLLGSGEKAQGFLEGLAEFAAKTPFELTGLQESSKLLLAFGFEAKNIIPIMGTVGDAISALGGGEEEVNRVVTALGQIQAKGKLSTEELLQLTELGIPGFKILQDELGLTGEQLEDSLRKGAIDADTAIKALLAGMDANFKGSMAAQSATFLGTWSNIQDTIGQIAIAIGQSIIEGMNLDGALKAVADFGSQFLEVMNAEGISAALQKMIPDEVKIAVLALAGAMTGVLVAAIAAVIAIAAPLIAALAPFIAIGAAIGVAIGLLWAAWDDLVKLWQGSVIPAVEKLKQMWQQGMEAMRQIGTQFVETIQQKWDALISKLVEIFPELLQVKEAFDEFRNTVQEVIGSFVEWVKGKWDEFTSFLQEGWKSFTSAFKADNDEAMSSVKETIQGAMNFIQNIIDGFVKVGQALWKTWGDEIMAITEGTKDTLLEVIGTLLTNLEELFKAFTNILKGDWKAALENVKNIAQNTWEIIKMLFQRHMENIKLLVKQGMEIVRNTFNTVMTAASTLLRTKWEEMKKSTSAAISNLKNSVVSGFTNIKNNIVNNIRNAITSAINSFKSLLSNGKSLVSSLASHISSKARSMASSFGSAFKSSLTSGIKAALNGLISTVNRAIDKINSMIKAFNAKSPIDAPTIPRIPALARGGNIISRGLALVGERGPELLELPQGARVMPLSANQRNQGTGNPIGTREMAQIINNFQTMATPEMIQQQVERALRKLALTTDFFTV